LDPGVHVGDHSQQIGAGLTKVLHLLTEIGMPLTQGIELLQGQRVHAPQEIQIALGDGQPMFLFSPVVRD